LKSERRAGEDGRLFVMCDIIIIGGGGERERERERERRISR